MANEETQQISAHVQSNSLLLHCVVALLLLTITLLTLCDVDGVEVDVVIRTHVRVADDIELKRMLTLWQRELQPHPKVPVDGDLLDREQLPRLRLSDDDPPVRKLLERVERRDDDLVVALRLLVRVPAERDPDRDRRARGVVALRELEVDIESRVCIDERRDIAPGKWSVTDKRSTANGRRTSVERPSAAARSACRLPTP